MSVLVDTGVWIDHFRQGNASLAELVSQDRALVHPMVIAEIACGTPPAPRLQTLGHLALLQTCKQASLSEVMAFMERERLYAMGCGLVDLCLLASTRITPGAALWTLDKRLGELAERFHVAYRPALH